MEQIRISVRNLVEFILQSGDIDNRYGSMPDKEAMQIGSRLHRKIQGQMGAAYRAEVPLKRVIDCGDYSISVEGRADGIFTEDEHSFIDEIKGVAKDVGKMNEPVPVHLAQAKCYACIYAEQEKLEQIGVQMTYINMDTEEVRRIRKEYTLEELKEWFAEIICAYRKWASFQVAWKHTRQESIKPAVFPYPYRDGQKDLAGAVYRTIAREKKLFIQAPTGVGKTIATVFPAVKAVGEGIGDKIFYLTAKTITRTVAQEAFSLLKQQDLQYKVVTLTAKEKLCICGEPDCNPVSCPYARGHYDRINDAVFELLTGTCENAPPDAYGETGQDSTMPEAEEHVQETMFPEETQDTERKEREFRQSSLSEEEYLHERENGNYTRDVILAHAHRWQVCPFEMSLDLSLWVDAIICDYNYVFDPQAKLKRFFADGVKGDYIFLIDEAHNLVERGREMYSAALYKEDFLEIKRLLKPYSKKAERTLEKCNKYLLEMKRECESYQLLTDIGPFAIALMNASAQLENLLEDRESVLNRPGNETELRKKVLDFYFQVRSFLEIYEELDDSYQIYTEQEADGRFKLKLYCIQPAGKIGDCLAKGRGTILFSATLLPVRYYMQLLSGTEEDYAVYAKSTFDPANKKLLIGTDVSSRYTRRGEAEYRKIARYIEEIVQMRAGNYLVFFPSYKMMEEVQALFEQECRLPVRILTQNSRMTESQREEFLEEFRKTVKTQESLLGFCVMGGIFGEGIDLKRDQLIGAVIVGTGLPQICNEREILKQYYDRRNEDGFAYAYQYPGMNKVMQSAGRVIRTDEDRGVILLLDERFCQWQYRSIFPREWADYEVCSLRSVREKLSGFWEVH